MAISQTQFNDLVELFEQTIIARNLEEYLLTDPGAFPAPDPSYAEVQVTAYDLFQIAVVDSPSLVAAEVLTTGSDGRATITFDETEGAIVTASVVDATADNLYFTVVVESVTDTSAVVRVLRTTAVTVLGISVLGLPAAANAASVHVMVSAPV